MSDRTDEQPRAHIIVVSRDGSCRDMDSGQAGLVFKPTDMLDTYPLPVRARTHDEARAIAAEWAALGDLDDVGDLMIGHNRSTCWLERIT